MIVFYIHKSDGKMIIILHFDVNIYKDIQTINIHENLNNEVELLVVKTRKNG